MDALKGLMGGAGGAAGAGGGMVSGGGIGGGAVRPPIGAPSSGNAPSFATDPKLRMMLAAGQSLLDRGQMTPIGGGYMMRDRGNVGKDLLSNVGQVAGEIRAEDMRKAERQAENEEFIKRLEREWSLRGIEADKGRGHSKEMFGLEKDLKLDLGRIDHEQNKEMFGLDTGQKLSLQGIGHSNNMTELEKKLNADKERIGILRSHDLEDQRTNLMHDAGATGAETINDMWEKLPIDQLSLSVGKGKAKQAGARQSANKEAMAAEIAAEAEIKAREDRAYAAGAKIKMALMGKYGKAAEEVDELVADMLLGDPSLTPEAAMKLAEDSLRGGGAGTGAGATMTPGSFFPKSAGEAKAGFLK